ncbi:hypothetical protein Nepgr_028787 [Nepenthes gracilis]|uniref:Dof zinc finger protein n=1 Tax=Nepenthes gracilis TaxID=150966 RepID=A0AAD3TDI5_NEPGR|nr:hypothetical protein Nepgr_028787 [Nepenthes gracilis]
MERPTLEQIQQQQQTLKCPRCDSTNTKFCYYNNYSLSQPRYFCKACKRYWTRGGTLRNVPVGGGCRKNKKLKRAPQPSSSNGSILASSTTSSKAMNPSASHQPQQIDLSSSSNHINHLYYWLPINPSDINLPYSSRYHLDQPHQLNGLELGFSSGILNGGDEFRNGYVSSKQIIQDLPSPNNMLSNYNYTFGSSSSSPTTTTSNTSPTVSSLLASSLQQQQKFTSCGLKYDQAAATTTFPTSLPYEDLPIRGVSLTGMLMKEAKSEYEQHKPLDGTSSSHNQTDQTMMGPSDLSVLWNGTSINTWLDPSNIGSSVTSLI